MKIFASKVNDKRKFYEMKLVIGVSSKGKGFGAAVYFHLKKNGYNVFGLNKNIGKIENAILNKLISEIPHKIEFVVTVIPPSEIKKLIEKFI